MERVALIVNTNHDTPTSYLAAWMNEIVVKTQSAFFKVVMLEGVDANKAKFESTIAIENPSLIIVNAHGSADSIFGFNYDVLLSATDNIDILSERNMHALACETAKMLGVQAIQIGAKSFIGYKENFEFWHKNKKTSSDILADDYARPTLSPAFKAVEALLEGKSAEEAFRISQQAHVQSLINLITNPDPDFNAIIAASTQKNRVHQTLLGGNLPTQPVLPTVM